MKLLGKDLTIKEFDELMCEQSKGKQISIVDNKIVAINPVITENDILNNELQVLLNWFEEYDNQIMQFHRALRLGISFDKDINVLDSQAIINQNRIKEIRNLLNIKKP